MTNKEIAQKLHLSPYTVETCFCRAGVPGQTQNFPVDWKQFRVNQVYSIGIIATKQTVSIRCGSILLQ
jgi:hypothetical protein